MLDYSFFESALPLQEFLKKHGTPGDVARWEKSHEFTSLSESQKQLLSKFVRRIDVLVLAGAWCGDCVAQCPAFERFAEIAPMLQIRYLDRDAFPEAQNQLQINGGNRVPVVVFFSEDGKEVSRYGERTLTAYRRMVSELGGEVCGSGIVSRDDAYRSNVIQDWLNEFERVQWILRLSPRLRRLHAD